MVCTISVCCKCKRIPPECRSICGYGFFCCLLRYPSAFLRCNAHKFATHLCLARVCRLWFFLMCVHTFNAFRLAQRFEFVRINILSGHIKCAYVCIRTHTHARANMQRLIFMHKYIMTYIYLHPDKANTRTERDRSKFCEVVFDLSTYIPNKHC